MSEAQRKVPAAWEGTTNWYWRALRNSFDFKSRACRSEFWWFTLGDWAITIVLALLGAASEWLGLLSMLYFFLLIVPRLAVKVRRLHDTNRSGWLVLWLYGPPLFMLMFTFVFFLGGLSGIENLFSVMTMFLWLFGAVWFWIVMCLRGTPGRNRYGADALGGDEAEEIWADIA